MLLVILLRNTITANLIGNVTGSASNNVLKAGDTMTGSLTMPAGTTTSPSILFSGSTNTGISAPAANTLSFDTNGVEAMNINATGGVTIDGLNSTGVVHTNTSGLLSTSLIVNADITPATIANSSLAAIASTNTPGAIVVRDGSGNFSTNEITIVGTVTNPTDAATKAYVDAAVSTGIVAHTPALVVSATNVGSPPAGLQTIDGITLNIDDRVLLIGQTNEVENGIWLAQSGDWIYPTDWAIGSTAGEAYVLILSGDTYGGSSWLCNTPTAIIGTNPIMFAEFSLPNQVTGANIGAGTGQVYQSKTGLTLNFRTLLDGVYTVITTNTDDITIDTNATSANTPSTSVARDASGNFSAGTITAALTGSASNNVLKAGDSMTGTLNMLTQNEVRFQDAADGTYVGINAPTTVPTSYTLALPSTVPTISQTLRAGSATPTQLEWVTEGGSITPVVSRIIYVTKYGNDTTGDGSFDLPFASIAKGIDLANTLSSASTPVTIFINAGTYVEDNSTGPLSINVAGVSIIGDSPAGVIFIPNTPTNDFLVVNQTAYIGTATFMSFAPLATGISLTNGTFSILNNLQIVNFATGVLCAGTASSYLCESCEFINNGTGLNINDTVVEVNVCTIVGADSLYGSPANTGLSIAGSTSVCAMTGGACTLCATGLDVGNNALLTASAAVFKLNEFDVIQTAASHMTLSACTFAITTTTSDIKVQISDPGTYAEIVGCQFNGKSITSVTQAAALIISNGATLDLSGGGMKNYTTAIQVGTSTDTSATQLNVSAFNIHDCTTDIVQEGSASLNFNASVASSTKISINDPTNVDLAYFDLDNNNALTLGSTANVDTSLLQAAIGNSNNPGLNYLSSLYSTQAIGLNNPTSNPSTLFALSNNNTNITAITTDRTKTASINLFSDEGSPVGGTSALRGWDMLKTGTAAVLSFNYQNSDTIGQSAIPAYTVMQLDGVNNQLQLPTVATQIVFASDTNLYRSAANVLQTDDNFVVGTLTPGRAVFTDPTTNQLASSITTNTELSYLSGTTSSVQTQLNSKVAKAGDTMTGALQLPAGTTAVPSLIFTGSTTTGLSANGNDLSFSTNGAERMEISSAGIISIDGFTTAGVVHNDASGNLSSSLITNADIITNAGITDSKLATITTAGKVANSATTATSTNTASTIVSRDTSGNFSAGTITANLNGNATTATSATTATTATNFSGSLTGDVTGTQGATVVSLVGGQTAANVAAGTVLANAATNLDTASTIVKRDASGNFFAGIITANLTGSASNNVLKAGDSMTGALNMLNQQPVIFQDSTAGNYVGINAPTDVIASYTLSLPNTAPTINQTLRAGSVTPSQLQWVTEGGSITPDASRVVYVTQYGNDTSGDGSFDLPYASLAKAITLANSIASASTPVTIFISAGTYIEDNSAGPLSINTAGISIVGDSPSAVILIPNTPTNDFLVVNQTVYIGSATFMSFAPMATGISLTIGNFSILNNLQIVNFATGILCAGTASSYLCESCEFINTGTGLVINDTVVEVNTCTFIGADSLYGTPANTGLSITGSVSVCAMTGGSIALCTTGLNIGNNALLTASAAVFKLNTFDVIQTDASHMTLSACTFGITTSADDIEIQMSGPGTYAEIIGCQFNGKDIVSMPGSTGLIISDGAMLDINGGGMKNYNTALQVGTSTDTSSTQLNVSAFNIKDCTTDIMQEGSASLNLNASTVSSSKISINDPTNVNLAYFDLDNNNALTVGSTADTSLSLLQVAVSNDPSNNPCLQYLPSLYSTQAMGFHNPISNPSTFFTVANDDANFTTITTDRTKVASINLLSDEGSPFGGTTALRGWDMQKTGTAATLAFNYQNSDTIGQPAIAEYTVMQLDGVNNLLELPTAGTQIVFAGDTNLYRSSAAVLQTDDNFVVGTLTPNRAVVTDPSTNQLASSTTSNTELGFLTGTTSAVQTQLNSKVAKAGDTMTGTLQLPAGATTAPSLTFTGSTTTGLSANSNSLSFSTNGAESMKISSGGIVSIDGFTLAGVVHNDASGNLSTSLITNSDIITNAGITDSKLANITTAGKVANSATTATNANTASAIVARDASGNFSAGTITANLIGNVTGNATTATSAITATTATNFTGSLSGDVTGTQSATVVSTVGGQTAANVAAATVLANAATNANTPSTIVARDASGNFSAGTITANLIGNVTGNATTAVTATNFTGSLSGDVTGTQGATVVSFVGGQTAANVASGTALANAATNANTASTIVKRDASGNFSAGTITANLNR